MALSGRSRMPSSPTKWGIRSSRAQCLFPTALVFSSRRFLPQSRSVSCGPKLREELMGGKVKVPLYGNPSRAAFINTDATVGATIGLDLRLPDGSVPSLDQLALLLASRAGGVQQGGSLGNASVTLWRLIREVPPNVQQVE